MALLVLNSDMESLLHSYNWMSSMSFGSMDNRTALVFYSYLLDMMYSSTQNYKGIITDVVILCVYICISIVSVDRLIILQGSHRVWKTGKQIRSGKSRGILFWAKSQAIF